MTKGERVKQIRLEEGLTLEKFGKRLGVTSATVSRIENGIHEVTDQMAVAICREYGVNEEWLETGKGKMKRSPDEFSLDEYARQKGATEEEIILARAYFSIDPEIRKEFFSQIKSYLEAQELSEQKRQDLHDDLDREIDNQKKVEEKSIGSDSTSA